jgi:hypothetical protein
MIGFLIGGLAGWGVGALLRRIRHRLLRRAAYSVSWLVLFVGLLPVGMLIAKFQGLPENSTVAFSIVIGMTIGLIISAPGHRGTLRTVQEPDPVVETANPWRVSTRDAGGVEERNYLEGINGWLLVPAVFLILSLLSALPNMFNLVSRVLFREYGSLGAGFGPWIVSAGFLVRNVFWIVLCWQFFRKARNAPKLFIVALWLDVCITLMLALSQMGVNDQFFAKISAFLGMKTVAAISLSFYLWRSERVKVTFVR